MKFTTIVALAGVASAVHISADPYPTTSGTKASIKGTNDIDTQHVGTTGGFDSKTLQSKTPATTSVSTFNRVTETPTYLDSWHGFQEGERFQIHSGMDGNRVLFATLSPIPTVSEQADGKKVITHSKQFEVQLRESEGTPNEYWYWHEKTQTVRNIANGEHCLTWDHTKPAIDAGVRAVVRPCEEGLSEKQGLRYIKETWSLSADAGKNLCLATQKSQNDEGVLAVFATCAGSDQSQVWFPMYRWQSTGPHWNRLQNE
jgi:hypothetical protein